MPAIPRDQELWVGLNDSTVAVVDTSTNAVTHVVSTGGTAPLSTGGIEQPVWDGAEGKFYIAIPATKANPNGEIDELDPLSMTVTRSFPTACKGPSGLAPIPNQRLITACGDVLGIASGKVVTTVSGVSADEIWTTRGISGYILAELSMCMLSMPIPIRW